MIYEDPLVPEGINTSTTHPLVTASKLLISFVIVSVLLIGGLLLTIRFFAPYIPFSIEKKIVQSLNLHLNETNNSKEDLRLANIVSKLIKDQDLKGVSITIHYSDSPDVNAFATLGGNIIVNKGLIDVMDSENMLAMVIGHEIGHVVHRDTITALAQGATLSLVMIILGSPDNSGLISRLTTLSYSREVESEADQFGLALLYGAYHNSYGAMALFDKLDNHSSLKRKWFDLAEDHPSSIARKQLMQQLIKSKAYIYDSTKLIPLAKR